MKAIFLSCNQALYEEVLQKMKECGMRGYTGWEEVTGCGMTDGEPHLGDHAWPTLNSSLIAMAEEPAASRFLDAVRQLDADNPLLGIRAFWWEIGGTI
ncbi:MAG: hypothetical protein J1E33_01480 [Alistipes sp.]|nr:hypothetical protein [Alistipes sp.]